MNIYTFELTDIYSSDNEYIWYKRYEVTAKNIHSALKKVSKLSDWKIEFDGYKYVADGCKVRLLDIDDNCSIEEAN